jgi:ATP-binding cassette subfamily F protein uup
LAILFRNPNFLILDEPTNDLDLPTLSVLENFLMEFPGCLLIVSHDRYFMDRLVDHLFVFEGEGEIRDFPGNYSQYREWQKLQEALPAEKKTAEIKKEDPKKEVPKPEAPKKKLSFKEQHELETLGNEISKLEKERTDLTEQMADPALPFEKLQKVSERINQINETIDAKEMRWLELSEA